MATSRRPYGFSDRSKKDDDLAQKGGSSRLSSMLHSLITVRKRRVLLILVAAWLLYLFVKNIPTDLPSAGDRIDTRYGRLRPQAPTHWDQGGQVQPQSPSDPSNEQYDGPIKFFKLGASLRHLDPENRDHVLFAFSSPQSSSLVLVAACTMASNNRTTVHVASMGTKEMILPDLLALNGIASADCPVWWHDAQPDFALQSTTHRMQTSCEAAVAHISRALNLRAIFYDSSHHENAFFLQAVKNRIRSIGIPLLQVPNAESWMLKLGVSSLMQWDQIQIDILIHVPRDAAGSLMRLLRTIREADYCGLPLPRITIELPPKIDGFIFDFLATFQWPPGSTSAESKLVIRHRLDSKLMSTGIASTRFVESFYPARPAHSHVLVLSADAELAPSYYQLLMYVLLEYHYGNSLSFSERKMIGFSLTALPSSVGKDASGLPLSFWQRPSAEAALYFGEEWNQLHQFLTHRLSADPEMSRTIDSQDGVAATSPSWLNILREWMQIEGLFLAYLNVGGNTAPPVTIHTELQQVPEELALQRQAAKSTLDSVLKLSKDGEVLTAEDEGRDKDKEGSLLVTASLSDLLVDLAGKGDTAQSPGISTVYNYDGKPLSWKDVNEKAEEYTHRFAQKVGKCSSRRMGWSLAVDGFGSLFCQDITTTD